MKKLTTPKLSPMQEDILILLTNRAATSVQIGAELARNSSAVRTALTKLQGYGLVTQDRSSGREAIWRKTE